VGLDIATHTSSGFVSLRGPLRPRCRLSSEIVLQACGEGRRNHRGTQRITEARIRGASFGARRSRASLCGVAWLESWDWPPCHRDSLSGSLLL
jgi:hypothetical protein